MKKVIVIIIMSLLMGCATVQVNDFQQSVKNGARKTAEFVKGINISPDEILFFLLQ